MATDSSLESIQEFLGLPVKSSGFMDFISSTRTLDQDFPGRGYAARVHRDLLSRPTLPDEVLRRLFATWRPEPEVVRLFLPHKYSFFVRGAFAWSILSQVECPPEELESIVPPLVQEFFLNALYRSDREGSTNPSPHRAWFAPAGMLLEESASVQEIAAALVTDWDGEPLDIIEAARSLSS